VNVPIVLAPLAGGPSTPALAAAVSEAGGLGFLAAGYLAPEQLAERIDELARLTRRPFGVNLFVPSGRPADSAAYAPFVARLREVTGAPLGEPRWDDDGWQAKLEIVRRVAPAVVSFTFGCPAREVLDAVRAAGSEAWVTVTSPEEAREAVAAGADRLVVQGAEAGGHRGSFTDRLDLPLHPLRELLAQVREAVDARLVATGGIASREAVAGVLDAGASAVQVGSAFMLCPEAGTSDVVRRAFASGAPTALTRVFTGRLARGIRNGLMEQLEPDAVIAYPEIHYVTAPMRAAARAAGDPDRVNLWAGEAYALAREAPAAEVVRSLAPAD
jgi:nitronate monooxygenase